VNRPGRGSARLSHAEAWSVLGLDRSASPDEIRAAYRARAHLLHPDLHAGRSAAIRREAERAMIQLTEAYDALTAAAVRPRPRDGLLYRLGWRAAQVKRRRRFRS